MKTMKKVLIISYYWPPSGGAGVQRWLKFVKYLPQYGWKPIVIVPENPEYPVLDATLAEDIPEEAEIIKLPIWEPYGVFKKLTGRKKEEKVNNGLLFDEREQSFTEKMSLWIRGNFLIPDPRLFWVTPSVKRLKKLIPTINPDMMITTGTPHSVHLIGRRLKHNFPALPWLADLRDPWSTLDMLDQFYSSRWAKSRQQSLENSALRTADVVTTVSPTWTDELQQTISTHVHCITNGFDRDDFNAEKTSKVQNGDFIISHVGIINSYRNPEPLWSALEELSDEIPEFAEKLKLQIIGITDAGLGKTLDKFPLIKERTTVKGYIPHKQVVEQYQKSACLLLLLNNTRNSKGHIPGKFFEYVASGKPILAISPEDSDVAAIIRENNFGYACPFDEKTKIKHSLLQIFQQKKQPSNKKTVDLFSRENLTKKLVTILNSYTEK